jgi:hypothetical protein
MFVLEARYLAHKVPVVTKTPSKLRDFSMSDLARTKVSYFGYEFEVPWSDIDESATKVYQKRVVISFKSGLRLMFASGPPKEFVSTVLSSGKLDSRLFQQYYGDALQSDYDLTRLMLESTPDRLTLLTPKKDAVGEAMMLAIKAIAIPEDSGLFSIKTAEFKGFQYGEPQNKPKKIIVDLFADDGDLEFMFFEHDPSPATTVAQVDRPLTVSQAEINAVIQTTRKIRPKHDRLGAS